MRYVENDKYTIAWFKLAECVAKGEKEKAFGVYRLLMHSLEDQAYAYQLEGDLLEAFQDERSIEKYSYAAQLYHKENRYKEAAALYEELIFADQKNLRFITILIDIYKNNKPSSIWCAKFKKIFETLNQKRMPKHQLILLEPLKEHLSVEEIADYYLQIIILFIKEQPENELEILPLLKEAVHFFSKADVPLSLQKLRATLREIDKKWYQKLEELCRDYN